MKRRYVIFLILFLVVIGDYYYKLSYNNDYVAVDTSVSKIVLNKKSLQLQVGKTEKLSVTVTPSTASSEVIWVSNNKSVATVSKDGTVSAVGVGRVSILVVSRNNYSVRDICTVVVTANSANNNTNNNNNSTPPKTTVVNVSKITLNSTSLNVKKGATGSLRYTISPSNATNKEVSWSSSNLSVATVSSSGVVTAVGVGTATITVTSKSNPGVRSSCNITVKDDSIHVTKVKLNVNSVTLNYGETYNLKTTVSPLNATNKSLVYTSNNPSIVSVDNNGKIKVVMNINKNVKIKVRSASDNKVVDSVIVTTRGKLKKLATVSPNGNLITVNGEGMSGIHVSQGFCVANYNGNIYLLAAMRDGHDKNASVKVYKRVVAKDGKVSFKMLNNIKKSGGFLGHANDMTYVPGTNYVYVVAAGGNKSFKLSDSFSGKPSFKKSYFYNGTKAHTGGAIAYDSSNNKYYFAGGGYYYITDSNMKTIMKLMKVDGKYVKNKKGTLVGWSIAQGIGSYNGKILIVRHNQVKEGNSTVAKPHNAIDVYNGNTGEYLGTNIIKLGSNSYELETVDYYGGGNFAIYYYEQGKGRGYVKKIKLNLG